MKWHRTLSPIHYEPTKSYREKVDMPRFDMVRARYAMNFIEAMKQHGWPSEPILEPLNLSEEQLRQSDQLIPAHQLWEIIGQISLKTGLFDLGLEAGQLASVAAHGKFGELVFATPTLVQRMTTFCKQAKAEYSRADFWVETERDKVQFCRGPIFGDIHQIRGAELYVVAMMIETVGPSNGHGLVFETIYLQTHFSEPLDDYLKSISKTVFYGQAVTRLELTVETLARSIDATIQPKNNLTVELGTPLDEINEFSGFKLLVEKHSNSFDFTAEKAARMYGVHLRKLQRYLSMHGTSFRELNNNARFARASKMLRDTNTSITEIAESLGYTNSNNFTRAYRNWYGLTPSTYREFAKNAFKHLKPM